MNEAPKPEEPRPAGGEPEAPAASEVSPRSPGEGSQQVLSARDAGGIDVRATIEAAELAAEEIRRDAEQRASAHLRAAREHADRLTGERVRSIAAVTDELISQAATIRAHSDNLAAALRRATEALSEALEAPAPAPPSAIPPAPTAISATGVHEDAPLEARWGGSDGPEFRARQLAAAGASRRTIAIVLRREFGVEPLPVIEQVLG